MRAHHSDPLFQESLSDYYLYCEADVPLLFTENETNNAQLFGSANASPYVKDGINNYRRARRRSGGQSGAAGNQGGARITSSTVGPGQSQVVRLRLTTRAPEAPGTPFDDFDAVFAARLTGGRRILRVDHTPVACAMTRIARASCGRRCRACSGPSSTSTTTWAGGSTNMEPARHLPAHERRQVRNGEWSHMFNDDIISMPDKWEYPWYAAWDLAFHMIPLGMVDADFAKQQLDLMLRNDYLHPNGQLPAYEWNFGDVNPPVHAWATMQLYLLDRERRRHRRH